MYCQECGKELTEIRIFRALFMKFLKCNICRNCYLNFDDSQRETFPLVPLHDRRAQKALEKMEENKIENAFMKVKTIDFQTISIVDFENALIQLYNGIKT